MEVKLGLSECVGLGVGAMFSDVGNCVSEVSDGVSWSEELLWRTEIVFCFEDLGLMNCHNRVRLHPVFARDADGCQYGNSLSIIENHNIKQILHDP